MSENTDNHICVAINDDINPDNTNQVWWAIAYRCNPADDIQIINYKAMGHAPHTDGPTTESILLIDATLKVDFPPVALPKREYMEKAKGIWQELNLPPLKPESPWCGYSLGEWNEEWDTCASLAAQSDWLLNGKRSQQFIKEMLEPQMPTGEVIGIKPQ